jgi:hypothetical protein
VLRNSHDGSSTERLHIGLYRCVCDNQMTVAESSIGSLRFSHRGQSLTHDVMAQAHELVARVPQVLATIEEWSARKLNAAEQIELALQAWRLRWDNDSTAPVRPLSLLARRRFDDATNSLWHTFNSVQENLLQGGVTDGQYSETGRRLRSRAVTGVTAQRLINTRLWELGTALASGSLTPSNEAIALVN